MSEKRKKCIAWPEGERNEQDFINETVERLYRIRRRTDAIPALKISPSALDAFKGWYSRKAESADPFRSSFESREDSHVLRLAGLLSVSDERWELVPSDIDKAVRIIREVKEDGATIFEGTLPDDKLVIGIEKVRERLLEAGAEGISHTMLHVKTRAYIGSDQLSVVLDIMHELGMVQQFVMPREKGQRGRSRTIWRATKDILGKHGLDALLRGIKER